MRYKLPAVFPRRSFVAAGGLISFGPYFADQDRRAAGSVDRILRGEKPAERRGRNSAAQQPAQAGETKFTEVIRDGGFTRVRWLYSKQIKPTSAIVSVARGVRLDGFLPRRAPRLAIF